MDMAKERNQTKANLIRSLREARGWTQAQLAEIAGVTERTIQRLEKEGIASHETMMGVAQAFDRKVSDFETPSMTKEDQEKFLKKLRVLVQLKSGKSVLNLTAGAHGFLCDSPQPKNEEEASLFGGFLEYVKDYGEIWDEVSESNRMLAYLECDQQLKELEAKGFLVFGELKESYYKYEIDPSKPIKMQIAVVAITVATNPAIVDDGKGNKMWPVVYGQ